MTKILEEPLTLIRLTLLAQTGKSLIHIQTEAKSVEAHLSDELSREIYAVVAKLTATELLPKISEEKEKQK